MNNPTYQDLAAKSFDQNNHSYDSNSYNKIRAFGLNYVETEALVISLGRSVVTLWISELQRPYTMNLTYYYICDYFEKDGQLEIPADLNGVALPEGQPAQRKNVRIKTKILKIKRVRKFHSKKYKKKSTGDEPPITLTVSFHLSNVSPFSKVQKWPQKSI